VIPELLIDMCQRDLTHGRGSLALFELQGAGGELELAPSQGDGARRHQHHFLPARTQAEQIRDECLEPGAVDLPGGLIDEQRRADLDHDAACTS
jgi:hypothetical protein